MSTKAPAAKLTINVSLSNINHNDLASTDPTSPVQTEVSEADMNEIEQVLCSSPTPTPTESVNYDTTTTRFPVHRPSPTPTEVTEAATPIKVTDDTTTTYFPAHRPSPTPTEVPDDDNNQTTPRTLTLTRTRSLSTTSTVSTQLDFDTASPSTVQAKLTSYGIKVRDYVQAPCAAQLYETFYPKDDIAKFDYMTKRRRGQKRRQGVPGKMIAQLVEIGWITEGSERLLDIDRAELVRYREICERKKAQFRKDHPGEMGEWGLDGKGKQGHPYHVAWKDSGPEMQTNEGRGLPSRKQEDKKPEKKEKEKQGQRLFPDLEDHLLGIGRPPSDKYREFMANSAACFWTWLPKFVRGEGMRIEEETDDEDNDAEVVQPAAVATPKAQPRRAGLVRQPTLMSLDLAPPLPIQADIPKTPIITTPPSPRPKSPSILKKASGLFKASLASLDPTTSTVEDTNKVADETAPLTAPKTSRKRKTHFSDDEQEPRELRRSLRRKTKVARYPQ